MYIWVGLHVKKHAVSTDEQSCLMLKPTHFPCPTIFGSPDEPISQEVKLSQCKINLALFSGHMALIGQIL